MTYTQSNASVSAIEGVTEPVVLQYFETFNAGDFEATAHLFAPTGALHPPFESPIVGKDAIAVYLKEEALGMKLYPRTGIAETLEENRLQFQIKGKVQTSVFGVNVAWQFMLNAAQEIESVEVKLLDSPQELLKLRHETP
ncbi:MAG: nuclear transport factor 2 family protein [Microcystaceae cyanobacterium]